MHCCGRQVLLHTIPVALEKAYSDACIDTYSRRTCDAQEGADNGSLGDRPFKILNAGLALTSFVHLLVFIRLLGGEHAGPLLPVLLGVWGTSLAVSASGAYRGSD